MNKKWEYKIIPFTTIMEDPETLSYHIDCIETFNGLGEQGWELVSVDNDVAYFKRPK